MPYATQRDRNTPLLEIQKAPWPAPPLNLFLTGGVRPGVFDLCWDDPAVLGLNSRFTLLGVNVYRSFDSEFGPYHRITDLPVGSTFWRDQTDIELLAEDVSSQFLLRGECTASGQDAPRFVFRTVHPIVKESSQGVNADQPWDVRVFIDGAEARVLRVDGFAGEVEIDSRMFPDVGTQKLLPALIPQPNSKVTCYYRHMRSLLRTDLAQRVFYRVTSVAAPPDLPLTACRPHDLLETPLENAASTNSYEIEKLDWIWREAIRRNRWILEQGGERVRVYMRKNVGLPCPCVPDDHHKQPIADCKLCYGVGILGGYEGPYPLLIAPDDAEKRISQKDYGRTVEHSYEVWTGPVPLLSMRDFVLKLNGERYSIGAVRMPTNRNNLLQQHFNVAHLDEQDIRYSVPVGNPVRYATPGFGPSGPEAEADTPETSKSNIPDERELRGRTLAWENIVY